MENITLNNNLTCPVVTRRIAGGGNSVLFSVFSPLRRRSRFGGVTITAEQRHVLIALFQGIRPPGALKQGYELKPIARVHCQQHKFIRDSGY